MKSFLSVTEIAKITGKDRTTIFRWIKSGRLGEARQIGGEYQVPHKSFEKWWAQNVKLVGKGKGGR